MRYNFSEREKRRSYLPFQKLKVPLRRGGVQLLHWTSPGQDDGLAPQPLRDGKRQQQEDEREARGPHQRGGGGSRVRSLVIFDFKPKSDVAYRFRVALLKFQSSPILRGEKHRTPARRRKKEEKISISEKVMIMWGYLAGGGIKL